MNTLRERKSPRQIAVERFERLHGPEDFSGHERWRQNYFRGARRRLPKAKPLPAAVEARVQKLNAACDREQKIAINERVKKVLAYKLPPVRPRVEDLPSNSLDRQIRLQLDAEPAEFREKLSALYASWVMYAGLYFSDKLQLPLIHVDSLSNALATCDARCKPTAITFDIRQLRRVQSR